MSEILEYCNLIQEIIELGHHSFMKYVFFKRNWFDVNNRTDGIKVDEYDFTLVNANRFLALNELYILDSQARHAFYVEHSLEKDGHAVISNAPHDLCNMPKNWREHDEGICSQGESYYFRDDDYVTWYRNEFPKILSNINHNIYKR